MSYDAGFLIQLIEADYGRNGPNVMGLTAPLEPHYRRIAATTRVPRLVSIWIMTPSFVSSAQLWLRESILKRQTAEKSRLSPIISRETSVTRWPSQLAKRLALDSKHSCHQ